MPTLTLQSKGSTGGDAYIDSSLPADNFGSTALIRAGIIGTTVCRGLLRFDLSGLPAGALISSAFLMLYCIGEDSTTDRAIAVTRALTQWYEGIRNQAVPAENGSTWAQRNDFFNVNWSASTPGGQAGVDYVTPFSGGAVVITNIPATFTWTVTNDVQLWANGTTNNGWWLIANTADTDSRKLFANFENGGSNAPKLVITYTSNVVAAPTARFAVAGIAGPTAVKGSITGTPSTLDSVGSAVGPSNINVGYTIEPASADSVGEASGPTAVIGGLTFLGGETDAVGSTANPTVNIAALVPSPNSGQAVGVTVGPTAVIKSSIVLTPTAAAAVGSDQGPASLVDLALRPAAVTVVGSTVGKAVALRIFPIECTPDPMLYLTDGTFKENGQRNWLSLIRNPFLLNDWKPNIAQYKNGGVFSDSVLAEGRRLVRRSFNNAIEVMDMRAKGSSQDRLIGFIQELFAWQEAAADYWVSDWGIQPIYLIAKAARESNPRYALIHTISVPELSNPFAAPFFRRTLEAGTDAFTLRIERGPWLSSPPTIGECVPLSATRSWTITGWGHGNSGGGGFTTITGAVLCLVQTPNGDILAGTDDQAQIYRSSDNGGHWLQVAKLGATTDAVNAMVVTAAGNVFAAVTGSTAAMGIWKSSTGGTSWIKNLNDPTGQGYRDIAYTVQGNYLVAGGGGAVGEQNNLVFSNNEGGFWSIPNSKPSVYGVKSVAGQQEPVIATTYPGQNISDPFNLAGAVFFGYDTYYTIAGVGYRTSQGQWDTSTPGSGQMGNGGLDMAVFLYKNPQGSYYRRALWVVKSAANVADTEVWQWPNPAGGFNFGKLATITGKNFNTVYVDPVAWQSIPTDRTIWAGANGEIWVSYNSGLSWALATAAPVNQVRAILRTAQGTLIAGGDGGEVYIYTGDSGSQGGNTETEPAIPGGVVVNSYTLGMEETCDDAVIAVNKSTFSNLTHVEYYNGSTYTELQFATLPPYAFLGDTAVNTHIAYFGSKTSDINVPGGTFSNLVFELTRAAENITVVWEYWNGAAWTALTVQDSSAGFRTLGVGSVHWLVPANWATTAVNGVTGYWVRSRLSAVASNPVTPIHDSLYSHRYLYSANLPYVEMAAESVLGDLPAAAQIRWHNRAGSAVNPDLEIDRMVCGLRSFKRGKFFNAYLNASDTQIPFGISLVKDVDATWASSLRAPTNRMLTVSYAGAGRLNTWNDLLQFRIANTIARDYYGSYRAFVRVNKVGAGLNTWQLRLDTYFGSGGSEAYTKTVFPTTGMDWELLDFGQITIPSSQISFSSNELADVTVIAIEGSCTTIGVALNIYDLILIPTDEWAIDTRSPSGPIVGEARIEGGDYMDIDSISNPKQMIVATNRSPADLVISRYQTISNGPVMLQTRQQQRLWFLSMSYNTVWRSYPETAGSVQVNKQQKYLYARGNA